MDWEGDLWGADVLALNLQDCKTFTARFDKTKVPLIEIERHFLKLVIPLINLGVLQS